MTAVQTSAALAYAEGPVTHGAVVASTASIPRSCICTWTWTDYRWHLLMTFLGCPWHGRGA